MNQEKKDRRRRNSPDGPSTSRSAKRKKVEDEEEDNTDKEESDEEREEGGMVIAGVYVPPAPPATCSLETNGPRLIITHIVNDNFKSYQGRQVLGPFHKSFTAIIGPNGSGKSNVIDSMLFVFGYRATKIRSKKLSVLIHKSEKFQTLRSCTVAVHFALINDLPGDEYELVPNSEFVVARTAFSDNSSKYSVNGKTKTFKEVTSLLLSHGIDLKHNRFLILQGEVEQIAMMKPKAQNEHETGMLEYLEDIIGTVRYKTPISKLALKLESVEEERYEKLNRMNMVLKEKTSLRGPLQEAKAYLIKDNQRIINYNKYYQLLVHQCNSDIKVKESDKKKIDDELEEIDKRLKEIIKSSSSKETELNGRIKELETMKNQLLKFKDFISRSENRNTQLKEEISHHNKRRKKDMESKKQDETKLKDLLLVPEKNKKEIEILEKKKGELSESQAKEKENIKVVMAEVKKQTKPLNEKLDQLKNELIGLKNIKDTHKEALNLAKTELDLYVNNQTKEAEKLKQMKELVETSSVKMLQRAKEVAELEKKIPPCEREISAIQVELQKVRVGETQAAQEYNTVVSELEDKKHSAQANRSRGRVLDFIMKQKESGSLPGIFGRLGDLGGIDAKYDVAISTACGPLDHIVVDTTRTGKGCVDALKKNDVGRANFIALEKIAWLKNQYSRHLITPENVPRLFDLIQFSDEKFKSAFYYGLRDTLVAKDLEQAKRVAYGKQRFRVVTLDGEIIELAGTMSGGGNQKLRGRMGRNPTVVESANPALLEALTQKAKELQGNVQGFRDQRVRLEDSLTSRHRQLETWKDEYQTYSLELKELRKGEGQMKQQLQVQEKRAAESSANPEKVSEMEAAVKEKTKALEKATVDTDSIESKLKSTEAEISMLTGDKVVFAQKKLDTTTKQLEKITKEISKLNVAIKSSQREAKKAEDRIQSYELEIKQAVETLTKCKTEMDKLIEDVSKINEENCELLAKVSESETLIGNLRKETTSFIKEEGKLKSEKIKVEQGLEGFIKEIQHLKGKISGLESKIKEQVLHEIPQDDEELVDDEAPEQQETLKVYTEAEIANFSYEALKYRGTCFDDELRKMKFNPQIIKDYQEKVVLYKKRLAELEEVTNRRNEIRKGHAELVKARLNEFMVGFQIISYKLKEMYQMITFGGDAEFELADNLDPFSEGVNFSVRPPRKSWKLISNLSGGEKTLSSLALVFALHYYKPSPLYVMDEIDAALDFKNVSIVGHYIKERTKNAQFIIISLRSNMFELADVLVGIYKTYNCTKSVTITPALYVNQVSCVAEDELRDNTSKIPITEN